MGRLCRFLRDYRPFVGLEVILGMLERALEAERKDGMSSKYFCDWCGKEIDGHRFRVEITATRMVDELDVSCLDDTWAEATRDIHAGPCWEEFKKAVQELLERKRGSK